MPPLATTRAGAVNGRLVIYFHGAPGGPEECRVFDESGKAHGLTFVCLDRFALDTSLSDDSYYRALADEIATLAAGKPVDFVGFSIGAFVALQTCLRMPPGVRSLHLVSAAAPLQAGNFLAAMAGAPAFRLAATMPAAFMALSGGQGLLGRFSLDALFKQLFASATGSDKALVADARFRRGMRKILRACFVEHRRGYVRDVLAYVQPWQGTLAEVKVDTHVWHGSADNWSPVAMAEYLRAAIPACRAVTVFEGLSHYSCLRRAAQEICSEIDRA